MCFGEKSQKVNGRKTIENMDRDRRLRAENYSKSRTEGTKHPTSNSAGVSSHLTLQNSSNILNFW